MATSTTTYLEVANAVLLNMNERTVPALTGMLGTQLKNTIRSALNALADSSNWIWLDDTVNASSWSGSHAILDTNVSRVRAVSWSGGIAYIPVDFVDRQQFDYRQIVAYSNVARPLRWTYVDQNIIALNPYPTTSDEQAKIWFYVQRNLSLPTSESGVFGMPEQFVELLILGATAMYALRHNEDSAMANAFNVEYQDKLTVYRNRHSTAPAQHVNMYPGFKIKSYGNSTYR